MHRGKFHKGVWGVFAGTLVFFSSSLLGLTYAQGEYQLESVDFVSGSHALEIFLHTGSIVPYKTLSQSDSKIVLEVDKVTSEQTVRTNFSGAKNISHVIIQPVSDSKMRLIIRGEHLKKPMIAFKDTLKQQEKIEQALKIKAARQPIPLNQKLNAPPVDETSLQQAVESSSDDPLDFSDDLYEENLDFEDLNATVEESSEDILSDTAPLQLPESLKSAQPETTLKKESAPNQQNPFTAFWSEITEKGHEFLIQLILLIGLLAGAGIFIGLKLKQLKTPQPNHAVDNQKSPFKGRFGQGLNKNQQPKHPVAPNRGAMPINKKDSNPIGLNGIHQDYLDHAPTVEEEKMDQKQPPPNKKAGLPLFNGLAPKQQALSQYQKQAQPTPKKQETQKPKQSSPSSSKEVLLQEELKRAQEIRKQASAKAQSLGSPFKKINASAQKRPQDPQQNPVQNKRPTSSPFPKAQNKPPKMQPGTANAPIPDNPEVLNFLRSVADMMEKDGNRSGAKSIHKGIDKRSR